MKPLPEHMLKQSYEVEVLINGKPSKEFSHDGKVYIEGRKGTRFSIRMRNNSYSRKLFVPTIDGLSIMNGEEGNFESSGYIISGNSSLTIHGWRISDSEVAEFYFSSPDDSYRKRMAKGNNLGVIGVAVFEEKEKQRPIVIEKYVHSHCHSRWCNWCRRIHCDCEGCSGPWTYYHGGDLGPSLGSLTSTYTSNSGTANMCLSAQNTSSNFSEVKVNALQGNARQDIGTGWGETRKSEVVSVEFEREGSPSATFEIYYNTREQLENMGVNFQKNPVYVTPQAFPGQYCKPPKK
jgi:hypothetical protein